MAYTYEHPHPAVTVDACLFTILDDQLKILLIKRGLDPYKGDWALPGGFVGIDEAIGALTARGHNMAIVVNRTERAVGMVTLEDLLAALLGELSENSDLTEA